MPRTVFVTGDPILQALRALRDCGVIRAKGAAAIRFDLAVEHGMAVVKQCHRVRFLDYRLSEKGKAYFG